MKVVTWNVNGLRSLAETGTDFFSRLEALDGDVVCLQETKVTRDMLEESYAVSECFTSYFAFSRRRTGYSGVATFCKPGATPLKAEEGLTGTLLVKKGIADQESLIGGYDGLEEEFGAEELSELDAEGRAVLTLHQLDSGRSLVVINVYCPRADCDVPARERFQLNFLKLLEMRASNLVRLGHQVVIVGDINVSHKRIDHCDPYEDFELRLSRQWMTHFVREEEGASPEKHEDDEIPPWKICLPSFDAIPFCDAFRLRHPARTEAFTCWHTKTNSRANNYGTRLDYVLLSRGATTSLLDALDDCQIHPEVEGSDHCPVSATFRLSVEAATHAPKMCCKNFPEFAGGRQQKVSTFFQAKKENVAQIATSQAVKRPCKSVASAKGPKQSKLSSFFRVNEASIVKNVNADSKDSVSDSFHTSLLPTPPPLVEPSSSTSASATRDAWRSLLSGPPKPPLCRGHQEPAALRTVSKKGPNMGRKFWACARGSGKEGDPNANCNFFQWRR